jgi:anti-sigma B factor antagonist
MSLEISDIEGTVVITLPRRFDFDSAPLVEKELRPILEQHPERVLFDFSKTDYISSVGVKVLLAATRTLKETGGNAAFSSLCHQVTYIFEIIGFSKIVTIYETREKALKHMNKKH